MLVIFNVREFAISYYVNHRRFKDRHTQQPLWGGYPDSYKLFIHHKSWQIFYQGHINKMEDDMVDTD